MKYYLAIDIGASSGRHIIGYVKDGELTTDELYRFPNGMDTVDGHLVWNTDRLLEEVITGIGECFKKYPKIESLSIDTWPPPARTVRPWPLPPRQWRSCLRHCPSSPRQVQRKRKP